MRMDGKNMNSDNNSMLKHSVGNILSIGKHLNSSSAHNAVFTARSVKLP